MFRLNDPAIVISQMEHSRASGRLARLWGNQQFEKPPLPESSFVAGVALHDWHYGLTDNFPIDDLEDIVDTPERQQAWLGNAKRAMDMAPSDPIADLISKRHLLRLLTGDNDEGVPELLEQVTRRIESLLAKTDIPRQHIEFTDRITSFCDLAVFHVFRTKKTQYQIDVYEKPEDTEMVTLNCQVETGKSVRIAPWPFAVDRIQLDMIGFQREAYPNQLHPELIEITIAPQKAANLDAIEACLD